MTQKLKILHLEDVSSDVLLVARELKKGRINADIKLVDNKPDFKKALKEFLPDIILCDHSLAAFNSIEALKIINDSADKIPFIVVTGAVSEDFAVQIMKQGAVDYILKYNLQQLPMAVRKAVEKKKAEISRQLFLKYLKHSEERYRQIVEAAQEGIWLTDENGATVFVNKKMCDMLEYEEQEMTGKESAVFVNIGEKINSFQTINDINATSESVDMNLTTKYGKHIRVNITANPVYDDNKNYKGMLGEVVDITSRKLYDDEIINEKVSEQKNITRAVVNAHEKEAVNLGIELHENISQLLAASKLFLSDSLLAPASPLSISQSQECITMAMKEITKLYHVLVGPNNYYMQGLVNAIKKLITDPSLPPNLEINFNYNAYQENREQDQAALQFIIYRIVHEQLNNIVKHSGASVMEIEIKNEDNYLIVSIKDNGHGFDTCMENMGTGIKNIKNRAEMYDGIVEITSSPGNGCELNIRFKTDAVET